MIPAAQLWIFFTVVLGVVVLPGLDMACAVGSSLAGGRRAGLAAVAGIVAGGACHVAVAGAGLGIVLQLFPAAYHVLLLAGSLYMIWVGLSLLRIGAGPGPIPVAKAASRATAFRRGAFTNLTNPKAYLFAIVGAEYLLRLLPKGTHDYAKFITPAELGRWARQAGLELERMTGLVYNPLTREYRLDSRDVSVNYMIQCRRPLDD